MFGPSSNRIFAVLAMTMAVTLTLPERAESRATVSDRELVSKQRQGRSTFLYTYRLSIDNDGPGLEDVRVFVSCDNPGTTIVDDIAEFGDIPADQVSASTGTFSLRQDRRQPFDPECLVYEIGFRSTLIISGVATDEPLAGSLITARVIHPASGRPIIEAGVPPIEEFTTTAGLDGSYTVEIDTLTQEDFIELQADGVGTQEGATLTSSVGSVGSLHDVGADGSIIINSGDNGAVDITHITTALQVLAERENGGPITSDGALAAAQASVDGGELLTMAALIKTVVDNPNVALPPGVSNTLELVSNPAIFEPFLQDVQDNFPDEFATAVRETADSITIGFEAGEVPGTLYSALVSEFPFLGGGEVFEFTASNGGSVILSNGDSGIEWSINSDGHLVVQLLNPPSTEFFELRDNPPRQVRALQIIDQITLIRIATGPAGDQVLLLYRRVTSFPDDPNIPNEVLDDQPGPNAVRLAFRESGINAIDPSALEGDVVASYHFHQENGSVGLLDPTLGADIVSFGPGNTGTTNRRNFNFEWTVNADGSLTTVFANGDANRYVVYDADPPVSQLIVIGTLASGERKSFQGEAIGVDSTLSFTEAALENRQYTQISSLLDDDFRFGFRFLPGGEGCREASPVPFQWESTPAGTMNLIRFDTFDPSIPRARRGWEALVATPGTLGDRYWVIENLEFNNSNDPDFDFTDPAVTPGRLNAYELTADLSNEFDPCGTAVANSLTTTFMSNNAANGNMFDVTTTNAMIEVTGLDVNVDIASGTPFELFVYTVPGSFTDTITAAPGCVFNCDFDVSAWTLTASGIGTSNELDVPSFVDIDDFVIPANQTTGFWVTLVRDGSIIDEFRYTNGANSFSNGEVTIGTGSGTFVTPAGTDSTVANRTWNGTIYYRSRVASPLVDPLHSWSGPNFSDSATSCTNVEFGSVSATDFQLLADGDNSTLEINPDDGWNGSGTYAVTMFLTIFEANRSWSFVPVGQTVGAGAGTLDIVETFDAQTGAPIYSGTWETAGGEWVCLESQPGACDGATPPSGLPVMGEFSGVGLDGTPFACN